MGSRVNESPSKLFEVFFEVAKPNEPDQDPFILQQYPPDYNEEEVLKQVPKFAFPCDTERYTTAVDHFTFVLTNLEGKYTFGFCRHATGAQTCLCVISFLPWFEVFYQFLNQLAEVLNRSEDNDITVLLRVAYSHEVPVAGVPVTVVAHQEMFSFTAPDTNKLPSIPASRNLTEYYNAIDTSNMMLIFASMLHERRIIVTSKKLSRLTACVHAATALLYPMYWQHLFIPLLPTHLIDYISAPMPYVMGVHSTMFQTIHESVIADAVIIDADSSTVMTEYDDFEALPHEISSHLKKYLKSERLKTSMQTSGDAISRAFLLALVKLIGGYRDALRFRPGEPITFDPEAFIQSRSPSMQPFLQSMLQLQIFQEFINGRLDMLNIGKGFSDIFDNESSLLADRLNTQSRYKEWQSNMKKQGKKLQKGGKDIWSDFKLKVKSQGKKAYTGIRSKIGEMKKDEERGLKVSKTIKEGTSTRVFTRDRPATIVGPALHASRVSDMTCDDDDVYPPRPPPLTTMRPRTHNVAHKEIQERKYKLVTLESTDDSDAMLSYNRVSVNLFNDPDIQQAMRKSASVEDLPTTPKDGDQDNASSDSESSQSSSETAAEYEAAEIPYIDDHSNGRGNVKEMKLFLENQKGFHNVQYSKLDSEKDKKDSCDSGINSLQEAEGDNNLFSSSGNFGSGNSSETVDAVIKRPVPAPRRPIPSHRHGVISEPTIQDRFIWPPQPPAVPPKPSQRWSLVREPKTMEKPLIKLDSTESEPDVDRFDPFVSNQVQQSSVIQTVGDSCSAGDETIVRQRPNRPSVNRTQAFKKPEVTPPIRQSFLRDVSPDLSDDSGINTSGNLSILDFDPLAGQTKPNTQDSVQSYKLSPSQSQAQSSASELLHSWNIQHLSGQANAKLDAGHLSTQASAPGKFGQGSTNQTPNQWTELSPTRDNPLYFTPPRPKNKTPPTVPHKPGSVFMQNNPLYRPPKVGENTAYALLQRGTNISPVPSGNILQPQAVSSNPSFTPSLRGVDTSPASTHNILQPKSSVKDKVTSDPFADLVNFSTPQKPSPPKSTWEKFE